ncbi:copper resistance protein CopC [Rathayibacter festucae]|uniref:copper resistance CopC family protein n=1 Tax=Rathayibacter festucae TaxID=110937 RepID=UPI001FB39D57|nr:copper resistance CopC family protein [Rathayibacter festucae]MCJ1702023.1 copper resistance protein CopC [Rathayibacter festucae]
MTRRLAGRAAIATAVMLLLGVAAATPAAAHDSVLESSPAPDATAAEVTSVSLTFNDTLLDLGGTNTAFAIQVIGPDGRYYSEGCVALDGSSVSVPAALGAAGEYEVLWQVVSSDGHPTSDSYTFDYAPDAATPAAEGTETAPRCGSDGESDTTTDAAPAASSGDGFDAAGLLAGLSIGAAAIAVATAVTVFVIGRMRRRS